MAQLTRRAQPLAHDAARHDVLARSLQQRQEENPLLANLALEMQNDRQGASTVHQITAIGIGEQVIAVGCQLTRDADGSTQARASLNALRKCAGEMRREGSKNRHLLAFGIQHRFDFIGARVRAIDHFQVALLTGANAQQTQGQCFMHDCKAFGWCVELRQSQLRKRA